MKNVFLKKSDFIELKNAKMKKHEKMKQKIVVFSENRN
jgi:hypothetical protein